MLAHHQYQTKLPLFNSTTFASLLHHNLLSLSLSCVAGNAFWAYLASLCRFCRVRYLYVWQSRLTALERVKSTPYPSLHLFCVNIYTGRPRQLYNYSYYCLDCRLQNVNKNTNGKTKSKKKTKKVKRIDVQTTRYLFIVEKVFVNTC